MYLTKRLQCLFWGLGLFGVLNLGSRSEGSLGCEGFVGREGSVGSEGSAGQTWKKQTP